MKEKLKERFPRYVAFGTRSDEGSDTCPSTPGQMAFLEHLAEELTALGLDDVRLEQGGYLTATVPAAPGESGLFSAKSASGSGMATIGLLAHVDTSPDAPGAGVRPQVIENYDGGDIPLPVGGAIRVTESPGLALLRGHTLITSDGSTLLGADDKAGVAAIVTAAEYLLAHPEREHGRVRIAFTTDEEIGRGVDRFDVAAFGADYAYTVDGGAEGELEWENFNAARAVISFHGANIHPGEAFGRMVNALLVASKFIAALPAAQRPENTREREGFFHVTHLSGDVGAAQMECLVRDHSAELFEQKKALLEATAAQFNEKYGRAGGCDGMTTGRAGATSAAGQRSVAAGAPGQHPVVSLRIEEQYRNMREVLECHPQVVERARRAMAMAGVTPIEKPIRGGTDGARLSFMGLPCPNIFTGGGNFHSRYEYVSLDSMARAVEVILNICLL